jgi:hypothetical protein
MRNKGVATLWRRASLLLLASGFAGCGGVNVATESSVPVPLVDPMPLTVGIYYSEDFSKAAHSEERWGTEWKIDLGPYHVHMADKLFASEFRETVPVADLKSLPANPPYKAIIEPRIEQYSFITPRDTGAKYFAVTIRYRINVYAPSGELADSLTFTGYGSNASGSGITSTGPMVQATRAAMRDAAAKFLVQFPEQDVAKKLLAGAPLIEAQPQVAAAQGGAPGADKPPTDKVQIDTVPIVDPAATPEPLPPSAGMPLPSPSATPAAAAPTTPSVPPQPGVDAPAVPPATSSPSPTGVETAPAPGPKPAESGSAPASEPVPRKES